MSGKKKGKFIPHNQVISRNKVEEEKVSIAPPITDFKKSGMDVTQINIIDLPSKFMPYPEGAVIKYRPYYYSEIRNHDSSKNLTYREEVDFVLAGIYTSFPAYDLTVSDFAFINLLRRISNIGNYDISAKYRCKKCGNIVSSVFKAMNILVDYLGVPKLPVMVEFSNGKKYAFNPLTIGSYIELKEEGFKNKAIAMVSKCCVNAEYGEVYEFLDHITDASDAMLVEHLDNLLYHSVKPMPVKCSYVNKEYFAKDGWSADKLRSMTSSSVIDKQILELFKQYDINFTEGTSMVKYACEDLIKKMALVKEEPCGFMNYLELEGGDVFLGPFCNTGELIKTRVCYGL